MLVKSLFIFLVSLEVGCGLDVCTTPDGAQGDCKPLNQCPVLYALFENRPLSSNTTNYLRRSHCGFSGNYPKICCPTGAFQRPTDAASDVRPVESDLLPSRLICGDTFQDKFNNGESTNLDEFPWLALIEYEKLDGSRGFYCGGVLISDRYVLTAAHCVKGKGLPKTRKLVSVRLGEYNTDEEKDCIDYGFGWSDCAPPTINVAVEERIAHEDYQPNDINQYHDIGLLRLSKKINFTDFVKPICLPRTTEEMNTTHVGQRLYVAGWGKAASRSESNLKMQARVLVKPQSDCNTTYKVANIGLGSGQMCVGEEKEKGLCRGDSGGPLMTTGYDKDSNFNWYAAGVDSFGASPCGLSNWPGVYTKVSKYVPWIVSKMKP